MLGYKKGENKGLCGQMPAHYPADMVYLDGDKTKTVQDALAGVHNIGAVNALPNVANLNGICGFSTLQNITVDNVTLPAGARCVGYMYNAIGHFTAITNSTPTVYYLRVVGNTWTILSTS